MTKHGFHLLVAATVLVLAAAGFAAQVSSLRVASRVILSATPQAIGQKSGREELAIQVDSDAAGAAYCGYTSALLSVTPGTGSGFRYSAGSGRVICKYPDQELYCMSADGAILSVDEAYVRTSTPTATPTETPTATPTNTP